MKIKLSNIDPKLASREIENFILKEIIKANKIGGVIGLSGGIDSTTVAYLSKKAFDNFNKKSPDIKLNLFALIMPSKSNRPKDLNDSLKIVKKLGIQYKIIYINEIINHFKKIIPEALENDYNLGNLCSECRAVLLSRYAALKKCLILGTGNRDEDYCLGYFTKRGDGQVDISPIGDLSKRQVREVASYLGVPKYLVKKIPTAGLWKGQNDEKELGFNYLEAEIVIAGLEQGFSRDEIEKNTNFGFVRKKSEKNILIVDKILDMHKKNKFKLKMPPIAKVSKK